MFALEQAITEWRRQLAASGLNSPEVLDELENHLRDDVEEQMRSGLSAQESFDVVDRRIGAGDALKQEFEKITGAEGARPVESSRIFSFAVACVRSLLATSKHFLSTPSGTTRNHPPPMKHQLLSILNRKVVSDHIALHFIQIVGFITSWFVGACSFKKLLSLDLTEAQISFGMLLSLVVPLLIIVISLLLPLGIPPQHKTSQPTE